jgi:hypothetical protein
MVDTVTTERLNDYVCPEALVHWAERSNERMRLQCLERDIENAFLGNENFRKDKEIKVLRRRVRDLEKLLLDRSDSDHYVRAIDRLIKSRSSKRAANVEASIVESLMVRNKFLEEQFEEFLALKMRLGIE